jgi:putative permease
MENVSESLYKRLSYNLLSVVLILFILYVARGIIVPLSFSLLFALLLLTPTNLFQRLGVNKTIAALLSIVIALLIIGGIVTFLSVQIASFSDSWPVLKQQIITHFTDFEKWVKVKLHLSNSSVKQYTSEALDKVLSESGTIIGGVAAAATSIILNFVLIVIFTFLFLLYRGIVIDFFTHAFHTKHTQEILKVIGKTRNVARDYVSGLFVEMLIVTAMNAIGLYIVGVQYLWFLAVLVAILNVVPYLGIATGLVISVFITLANGSMKQVLGVVIVIVIVHLIDSNFLMPKVVGSKVKLNPIISLLGVIIGEYLWGIPGMFLAIPLIAMLKVLFDNIEALSHWGILLGEEKTTIKKHQFSLLWKRRNGRKHLQKDAEI